MQELKQVETSMNYLVSKDERPATYMYEPPAGTPRRSGNYSRYPMLIINGRAVDQELTLDAQGFMLRWHETKVALRDLA